MGRSHPIKRRCTPEFFEFFNVGTKTAPKFAWLRPRRPLNPNPPTAPEETKIATPRRFPALIRERQFKQKRSRAKHRHGDQHPANRDLKWLAHGGILPGVGDGWRQAFRIAILNWDRRMAGDHDASNQAASAVGRPRWRRTESSRDIRSTHSSHRSTCARGTADATTS